MSADDLVVVQAKRLAKTIQAIAYEDLGMRRPSLAECQELAARLMLRSGFHHLRKAGTRGAPRPDKDLPDEALEERRDSQSSEIQHAFRVAKQTADSMLFALRPTSGLPPRRLDVAYEDVARGERPDPWTLLSMAQTSRENPVRLRLFHAAAESAAASMSDTPEQRAARAGMQMSAGSMTDLAYIQARYGVAEALLFEGRTLEAAREAAAVMHMDTRDGMGARYVRMACHLRRNQRASFEALARKDDSTFGRYNRALLAHVDGRRDTARREEADRLLGAAVARQPLIADLLAADKDAFAHSFFDGFAHGGEDEAEFFLCLFQGGWRRARAVEWVRDFLVRHPAGHPDEMWDEDWVARVRRCRARVGGARLDAD